MKEVIIHIGFPKTGTSFLQKSFHENISQLKKLDINYPNPKDQNLPKMAEVDWDTPKNGFLLLNDEHLKESFNLKKTLYSEEGLFRILLEKKKRSLLLDYFSKNNIKVRFIVFYRDFYQHSISTWNQYIKRGKGAMKYHQFMLSGEYRDLRRLKKWIEISIAEGFDISVFKYDSHKKDLFKFFLEKVLGIKDIKSFSYENRRINRSLDYSEIEFVRLLNKEFGSKVTDTVIKKLRWIDLPYDSTAKPFITKDDYKKINEKYIGEIDEINKYDFLKEKILVSEYKEITKDSNLDKNYIFSGKQLAQISKGLGEIFKTSDMLRDEDAEYLKNIALEIQKGKLRSSLDLGHAKLLMKLAKRARPKGPLINNWLDDFEKRLGASKKK